MLLGVPVAHDEVLFNAARIYGPLQMSHLLANWKQIHADVRVSRDGKKIMWPKELDDKKLPIYSYQPVHVLEKSPAAVAKIEL
jgi:hypothetical protein